MTLGWSPHLTPEGQPAATLDAAFIRKDATQFQIRGKPAAGDVFEGRIFSSMRSFRNLTDPARLNVTPDRVQVVTVNAAGAFDAVIKTFGALQADLDTDAIMNNLQATDPVVTGSLIKIVKRSP
jgi:predicted Zn-dependent protease